MKKALLILISIFLACSNIQAKKLFVEMEFKNNSIKLDDGSNKKRQAVKGENGKDIKFTSLIGAFNYMSLQGWEFIDTKSVTSGSSGGGYGITETEVFYIFSKDVSDKELEQVVKSSYKDD